MQHDPLAWLSDVCQAIDYITAFVRGRDFDAYLADTMFRSAVERQFEIVGEALTQFAREAPDLAARIGDLRPAIAMRNALIHGYRSLEHETIRLTVHENLPELRAQVAAPWTNWATHGSRDQTTGLAPPSMLIAVPVVKPAWSLHRKQAIAANSSALPIRPTGTPAPAFAT
jgi:uncharacterized protein with HEPN domain